VGAAEQADAADEAGASDGASQLIRGVGWTEASAGVLGGGNIHRSELTGRNAWLGESWRAAELSFRLLG
jgi:hypothetical protein